MPDEVRLWRVVESKSLSEIKRGKLDLEERLEDWLQADISMLDPGLLVIGRQVETEVTGPIDLLCVDAAGDLVVVELKRDKTPREVTAQALDYASWVVDLSNERITSIAEAYLGEGGFEEAFRQRFGTELPETLNSDHSMLIVGSSIDPSSERIIKYLSDRHGVGINAATFQYFRDAEGSEFVTRVFLIEPAQVELATRTKGMSKRRPNLTLADLSKMAEDCGLSELYERAVEALQPMLKFRTTLSSIGFTAKVSGGQKVVLSLLPGPDHSSEGGLRYQLYKNRFAELTGLAEDEVVGVMPADHEYWEYEGGDGSPEWQGFQGCIVSDDEIDRLSAAISRP